MKFDCEEISISDESFGFTLTFSEKKYDPIAESTKTIKELMHSSNEYLMIQKTYAEDEFETEYFYFETNDPDKSGQLNTFTINLSRHQFLMNHDNELYEINIKPKGKEFEKIKEALKVLTADKGELIIHD